jgi:hypothetical protein
MTSLNNGAYFISVSNDLPPTLYSTGSNQVSSIGRPLTRTVQVKTAVKPLFGDAVRTLQNINMNGNNIMVDSFDSSDLVHFTNGFYNPTWRMATADVASEGGLINVGGASLYGHLLLGAGNTATVGPQGMVGDLPPGNAWGTPGWPAQSGIEPGWVVNDFNMDFPDVLAPFTSASALNPTYTSGNTTNYSLGSSDYYYSANGGNLTLKSGELMDVTGNARLYVPGSFDMQGSGKNMAQIIIESSGSLKIYVGSATGTTKANFAVVNTSGNAQSFQFYGLPSTATASWSGNSGYIGTIYAPEAGFTLNGGGTFSNPTDYQGACVAYSLTINGHFNFHYDENLKRVGPLSGYTLASWTEL